MEETYIPRYLKNEQPKSQDVEDQEVFAIVTRNPSRKVDANTLPPVAMDNDGNLFFMDPTPSKSDTIQAILGMVLLVLGIFAGASGIVCAIITKAVNSAIVVCCVAGALSILAIIKLKGEKEHGHK